MVRPEWAPPIEAAINSRDLAAAGRLILAALEDIDRRLTKIDTALTTCGPCVGCGAADPSDCICANLDRGEYLDTDPSDPTDDSTDS